MTANQKTQYSMTKLKPVTEKWSGNYNMKLT